MVRRISPIAFAALLTLCGCRSGKPAATQPGSPAAATEAAAPLAPAAAPVDPATAGTLSGVATFKGTPPARVKIDMSMDPACSMAPGDYFSEQYVVNHGGVANVFVYLKRGVSPTVLPASSAPAGTPAITIDQKGCRFVPHVAAIQQGGSVRFTNSDPTMHNVHTMPVTAGNASIDVSQGPGSEPQVRQFRAAENMLPIRCNNHPWMSAFLNVAPNPYFTISGPDGRFTLHGLPPGKYIVAAVHEKLGEQDLEVDVPSHGTAKAEFVFGPQ